MILTFLAACVPLKEQSRTVTTPADSPTETDTDEGDDTATSTPTAGWQRWSGAAALPAGLALTGYADHRNTGHRVDVGDVDADGAPDVLVTAPWDSAEQGTAWLVHGPITGEVPLETADARITATGAVNFGATARMVGDLDGDGGGEVIFGVSSFDVGPAALYVLPGAIIGDLDASTSPGAWLREDDWDRAGADFVDAGDLTGDGRRDVAVGAPTYDADGAGGVVYLIPQPEMAGGSLADAEVRILGEVPDGWLGYSLAAMGDIDGDGTDDLGVAVEGDVPDPGVRVFFGPLSGTIPGSEADAFLVSDGEAHRGYGQDLIAGGSDLDGDGTPDVAVGCPGWGGSQYEPAGEVAIVSGARVSGRLDLHAPDARITGDASYWIGATSRLPGDLDGDGRGDLLAVARPWSSEHGGHFLFYGGFAGELGWHDADAAWLGSPEVGIIEGGAAGGEDVTGDGVPDLVLGAENQVVVDDSYFGVAYVIPGSAW